MSKLIQAVREGLAQIEEVAAHSGSTELSVEDVYVVGGHERALNPSTMLVVGDRGSGKSFWCSALNNNAVRNMLNSQLPRLRLANHQVAIGFAGERGQESYPSAAILKKLLHTFEAGQIWRTVILQQLLPVIKEKLAGKDWAEKINFVTENPEQEERWLAQINKQLQQSKQGFIIVFDALDRLGGNWEDVRKLTQGLLRVALDMQSFSAIHLKIFMRPDMWGDQTIWAFPDASKLKHNHVTLEWRKIDLYGLLWHWLANRESEIGTRFRKAVSEKLNISFEPASDNESKSFYLLPSSLKNNEELQEELLNLFASTYMGANAKRGKTYAWIPNHLADAKEQVSPRSFLLALKEAARKTEEKGSQFALYHEAIKLGVTKASEVRMQELKEDYLWIDETLNPLRGFIVPAKKGELIKRWKDAELLTNLNSLMQQNSEDSQYLPPYALQTNQTDNQQLESLVTTLEQIGVLKIMKDGRVNIPDLFRIGAGISRKGGVKPVR